MADLSLQWFAPAILALVPALVRLRRGQTLARYLDDPAFPERLLGSRTLLTAAFAFAVAIEIVLWPRQTWWSLPLLLLSLVAAGWPLRRAMFAETWSVGTYVLFYVRLVVAIYGFWIVLMAAPWLTRFDGPPWIAPLLLGAVLVIWNEQHTVVLKWIFRARPVTAASLLERCRTIVARSNIVPPKIDYVDMKGGVFANAVALPDTATPSVLFTSSLLERLDEDEAVAIFAHEVAHLEHFNPRYLRKLRAAGWAIVMAAVTIGPLLHYYAPRFESFVWAWPFVVFAYTSILTVHRQKHETESDARAVALTGDAEALVRGLAKLHALGKVPRRLDPNVEVHLSHPSLARRVQAIRAAAGTAATRLDEPVTLQSGTTVVTLHADRLAWSEADGTSHALPYATLNDLRIEAGGGGAATLSAADTHGRRWTLSLAETDVARTQAALDVIDVRLRPAPSGVGVWRTVAILVNLLMMVAGLAAGQLASTIVALLASWSLEKPLARAAGAAGLVGGAIALRDDAPREMALILMLTAVLLLFIASRDRREDVTRLTTYGMVALGGLALLMLVPYVFATGGFLAAHQIANRWPASAVFLLAFAAAAWPRRRVWRAAAGVAAVAGAAVLVLGDTRTLDAVLRDPFLQRVDPPPVVRLHGAPSSQTPLAVRPEHVLLSPRGESVAARVGGDDYENVSYFIGRAGGTLTEVRAETARFVGERRILLAEASGRETVLRLVDTEQPNVAIWQQRFDIRQPTIAVDRLALRWRALGSYAHGFAQISGAISGGELDRREWVSNTDRDAGFSTPLGVDGTRLLLSTYSYTPGRGSSMAWTYWFRAWTSETRFSFVDRSSTSAIFRSPLLVQCQPSAYIDEDPVCSAHDGSRFHLGIVGSGTAPITPLAKFARSMTFHVEPGWITGWSDTPFALERATGRLVRLQESTDDSRWPYMITAGEESIGVVWWDRSGKGETILEIYPRHSIVGQ